MWNRLTHEHKIELSLLLFTCLFNLSFGVEKLLLWKNIIVSPGYWGLWYMFLCIVTGIIAYKDFRYDLEKDCHD